MTIVSVLWLKEEIETRKNNENISLLTGETFTNASVDVNGKNDLLLVWYSLIKLNKKLNKKIKLQPNSGIILDCSSRYLHTKVNKIGKDKMRSALFSE